LQLPTFPAQGHSGANKDFTTRPCAWCSVGVKPCVYKSSLILLFARRKLACTTFTSSPFDFKSVAKE
jgi:hypothetical protein